MGGTAHDFHRSLSCGWPGGQRGTLPAMATGALPDVAIPVPSTAAPAARIVGRFGVAGAIALAGALGCYVVLVGTHSGQALENLALDGARSMVPSLRRESLPSLSEVVLVAFGLALALLAVVALLRRRPVLLITTGAAMVGSVAAVQLIAATLTRPELTPAPPEWIQNDFPSGHVAVAVALGLGLVMLVPSRVRASATVVAAVWAIGVGQAVGITGWHRMSAVVGATLIVAAFACLGIIVLAVAGRVRPLRSSRLIAALVATLVIGVAAFLLGGDAFALAFVRLVVEHQLPEDVRADLVFSATSLAGSAAVAGTFIAFLWLLRPYALDEPG